MFNPTFTEYRFRHDHSKKIRIVHLRRCLTGPGDPHWAAATVKNTVATGISERTLAKHYWKSPKPSHEHHAIGDFRRNHGAKSVLFSCLNISVRVRCRGVVGLGSMLMCGRALCNAIWTADRARESLCARETRKTEITKTKPRITKQE